MASEPGTTDRLISARVLAVRRLRLLMVLSVLLPLVGLVAIASWLYGRAFTDAAQRLDHAARIAHEHALKLFDTNQMLLQRMQDALGDRTDEALLADDDALHQRLRAMAAPLPQVQGLFVIGADGRMLASSRVFPPKRDLDYTDRDWYQAHRAGGVPIYFTPQIVSRATGEPAFDMSQPRALQGQFGGTVHVSLRPEYLTEFYRELSSTERGLRMAVWRSDGRLIARWPDGVPKAGEVPPDDPTMRQIAAGQSAGTAQGKSPFDEKLRLRSFRRLGEFPLYVVASMDAAAIIAAWQVQVAILALLILPTGAALAASAQSSIRRAREEIQTLHRLAEETARRQRAEVALLQSQKLEAMGRLTGGVAHDFNNVLAVVSSNVELMRRMPPDRPHTTQLKAIASAVSSGTKLTRQLLAFARKQALLPEAVFLQERLPAMLDLLRPLLGSTTEISVDVDPKTPIVEVDPAELELALINLAVNAGDAMQGTGRLAITARGVERSVAGEPATRSVVIDVDDTGPGVDPSIAAHVFEPFFTTKPIGQGTGLGLSQVRAFCQSAGGDVSLLRAPGGGTRVRMTLRAAPAAAVQRPPPVEIPAVLHANVLLVEDNEEVAQATAQLLEAMGAQVTRVASARAAIDLIDAHGATIDVVLSDIELSRGMDGIALATVLLNGPHRLPVVLMTGYAQRLDEAMDQDLEVLPKPASASMLARSLHRASLRRALPGRAR